MKQVNMKIVDENNEIHCVSLNFFGSLALLFGIFVLMIATQTINMRAKIIIGCFFSAQQSNVRHIKNDCASPGVNKRDNFFMETIIH